MRWEVALDRALTFIFSPLALVGIRKCSRCAVRVRLASLGLLVSLPVSWVPIVRRARTRWDMAAHPEKRRLRLLTSLD